MTPKFEDKGTENLAISWLYKSAKMDYRFNNWSRRNFLDCRKSVLDRLKFQEVDEVIRNHL